MLILVLSHLLKAAKIFDKVDKILEGKMFKVDPKNNDPRSKLRGIPEYEEFNGEASFGELDPVEINEIFQES